MTIPFVQPVTVPVRLPDSRLWDLHRRISHGVATQAEREEYELKCKALPAEQDNYPIGEGL